MHNAFVNSRTGIARRGSFSSLLTRLGKYSGLLALALVLAPPVNAHSDSTMIRYSYATVRGVRLFYRQAGSPGKPVLLLLHGFPSSSFMFRNLIRDLADRYYVVAPDYPGFGYSDMPPPTDFAYTYEHVATLLNEWLDQLGIDKLSLYVFDYGAPVGFRLLMQRPHRLECLLVQNGNIYAEGLGQILRDTRANIEAGTAESLQRVRDQFELPYTRFEYLHGVSDPARIAPDGYTLDQARMDRPGNKAIQFAYKVDYRSNPPLYPDWQAYLRRVQPPTLVVWGENDPIFTKAGALGLQRDLKDVKLHFYPTGHFALEEYGDEITTEIRDFLAHHLPSR